MKARDVKIFVYTIFMFVILVAPAYYLSSESFKIITGNAALSTQMNLHHYDVYCAEEPIQSIEGLEINGKVNSTTEVPTSCYRLPSAYVVYVPIDSDGNQLDNWDLRLI